ncbi:MAG: hypothetical protein ACTSUF_04815 [Candidatus Heimdallarchaeaceae archaeon]
MNDVSDTNFVHIEFSISLRDYNNVILLLGFNGGYTGNNNYQCWIKDFIKRIKEKAEE